MPSDDSGTAVSVSTDSKARSLRLTMNPEVASPPKDQLELKAQIESVLSTIKRLYPDANDEADFRRYFVQITGAAQVGLVGDSAHPQVGKQVMEGVIADLIDQEGGKVKNQHLRALAERSLLLSGGALLLYAISCVLGDLEEPVKSWLVTLRLSPPIFSSFMVMLAGSFMGVTLSYAARTTTLTLRDLVSPDTERLRPYARLLVSAGWTVVFGYLAALQ